MTIYGLVRGMLVLVAASGVLAATAGAADETIRLWPGAAPGTEHWNIQERTFQVPMKEFGALSLVTDVTIPTLTVVRPAPAHANGTAVIVCPGGGFQFLAWEHEGLEVARWLAHRGITAFVLKYRVRLTDDIGAVGRGDPKTFEDRLREAGPKVSIARADAIQAIRHLRAKADAYGISRDRVGMMGFSAGAMTTMSVVLNADAESRPDFAAPIYGAMEDAPLPKEAPPLFIVHTQADALVPAAQSTRMFNAWTAAGRPAELHLYQAGSHGFGMRKVGLPVDRWTEAFEGWLRAGHLLDRRTLPKTTGPTDEMEAVGTWSLTYSPGDGEHKATLTVTKEASGLKAAFKDGDRKFDVTKVEFKDETLTFATRTERDGESATATFDGKVKGDTIKGSADWTFGGMSGTFDFEGKREAGTSRAKPPSVVAVPGKPTLPLGSYDVAPLGYQVDEFFISGTATSYRLAGKATEDGKWDAVPAGTAPYRTRIVVVRPSDRAKFSGTAVVEWLNVSGGLDVPVDWNITHREVLRRGHAYVAVSAQVAGIESRQGLMGPGVGALKKANPERYGHLKHPGDAYSFDIFSQAGRLVKDAAASKVLGPLVPQRMLAIGESQSAFYLTTYATAVDPIAKVYDGILVHSRFGAAAPLDGASMLAAVMGPAKAVKMRPDLRVPVLTVVTESDVLGWPPLGGSHAARQPDADRLRVWEVAGTAHADNYVFSVGFIDSGSLPVEKLAAAYAPASEALGRKLDRPMNFAPQHHYVVQAALWQLDRWVKTGKAAPSAPPLKLTEEKSPNLVTDANGLAEGGLRTPWVDVPTAVLSGAGSMVGSGKPFDAATLKRLYPGGRAEYIKKFEASLDAAIGAGFILPEDKQEIMKLVALSFNGKAEPARAKD
jgi:acetyl esterase/lipase